MTLDCSPIFGDNSSQAGCHDEVVVEELGRRSEKECDGDEAIDSADNIRWSAPIPGKVAVANDVTPSSYQTSLFT